MTEVIDFVKYCPHQEFEVNSEGFIVCRDCGVVLDDSIRLKNNPPKDIDSRHNEILNHNKIGYNFELKTHHSKYQRLNKLNNDMNAFEKFKRDLSYETSRILSSLNMPFSLKESIINRAIKYYKQLEKSTKFRSAIYVSPITVYIVCQEQMILINKEKLIKNLNFRMNLFNECYKEILQNNEELKKFRTDNFRKRYILKNLSGLKENFELSIKFMDRAKKILYENWNYLKHSTNSIITGVIYLMAKIPINNAIVSEFIGIRYSSIRNFYNRLLKLKNQ